MVESGAKWRAVSHFVRQVEGMFKGEYSHTIDTKGRLIVPAKFRERLGDEFVITKGLDGCLFAYPNEEWTKFEAKLNALPVSNKSARQFTRFFVASAASCEVDKQGRINIPQALREYALLDKDVVVIGVTSRVEIWSKEKWMDYNNDDEMDMDAIAEQMVDLGI